MRGASWKLTLHCFAPLASPAPPSTASTFNRTLLSGLYENRLCGELPVTEANVQAYMARAKSAPPEELFRQFLSRYRAVKGG